MGRIGEAAARRFRGFDCSIVYTCRSGAKAEVDAALPAQWLPLDEGRGGAAAGKRVGLSRKRSATSAAADDGGDVALEGLVSTKVVVRSKKKSYLPAAPRSLPFADAVLLSGWADLCEWPNLSGGASRPLVVPSGAIAEGAELVALFEDIGGQPRAESVFKARLITYALTLAAQAAWDRLLGLHNQEGDASACCLFSFHKEASLFHLARLVVAGYESGTLSDCDASLLLPRIKYVYCVFATDTRGTVLAALQR